MKTISINGVIFVYGNPLQRVREMAEKYNITVVGTSDPSMLIYEMKNCNDANQYFFFVTNDEELRYLNDMLSKIKITQGENQPQFFILSPKVYEKLINTKGNSVYFSTYEEPLTEKIIEEYILHTAVYEQTQYVLRKDEFNSPRVSISKMKQASKIMENNFNNETLLQGIREQFKGIVENQQNMSISNVLKQSTQDSNKLELETQSFLKEKIVELENQLNKVQSTEDIQMILSAIMELYSMMAEDLKESSNIFIDKLIKEALEKSKEYKTTTDTIISEIDTAIISKDKETIEKMLLKRDEVIEEVRIMEREVVQNANMLKEGLTENFLALRSMAKDTVRSHGELIPAESRNALQVAFNTSSKEVALKSKEMVRGIQTVVDDLQGVVKSYSKVVDFDTTIIESQQRVLDIIEKQKVVENVQYLNELTAKLRVLVSPTPNLGASTVLAMSTYKFDNILMLDFREIASNTFGFSTIPYLEFLEVPIADLEDKNTKVFRPLAEGIEEEELLNRLYQVMDIYDVIYIVVDRYFTVGIPTDYIQRVQYISNAVDTNLILVNETRQFYEVMLENVKQVGFILNFCTNIIYQKLNEKLVIAGIDPSEVRVNILPLKNELMGGENIESELKLLHTNFKY